MVTLPLLKYSAGVFIYKSTGNRLSAVNRNKGFTNGFETDCD